MATKDTAPKETDPASTRVPSMSVKVKVKTNGRAIGRMMGRTPDVRKEGVRKQGR